MGRKTRHYTDGQLMTPDDAQLYSVLTIVSRIGVATLVALVILLILLYVL